MNAEGQAADSKRRLQVAQEQVAEFAQQREQEATKLLQKLEAALEDLQAGSSPGPGELLQVCCLGGSSIQALLFRDRFAFE